MVRYLKRLKSSRLGRVQAFPMYGGLGMSAPSLHRESTDSLIASIKNEVGITPCQRLLKQEGTARRIESMQQSSDTPKNQDVRRGLQKIVACSQSSLAVPYY